MKLKELLELNEKVHQKLQKLTDIKGHDYATEDRLSNFKRVSKIMELLRVDIARPEGVALFFIIHKIDRVCNLIFTDKEPKTESIGDNIDDGEVYLRLLRAILQEENLYAIE